MRKTIIEKNHKYYYHDLDSSVVGPFNTYEEAEESLNLYVDSILTGGLDEEDA